MTVEQTRHAVTVAPDQICGGSGHCARGPLVAALS